MAFKVGGMFVSMAVGAARFAKDWKETRNIARKNAKDIDRSLSNTRKRGQSFTKQMGKAKTAAIALAGPVALGALIKRSIDLADKTVKVADKIGISTDALQEYRFAAELAGVEQAALDMGLQRFVRRAGEAAQGLGELKSTLDQYGISVRDSNGNMRETNDIMDDLADVIMNAESEQEQLRIAFKAFDSEGAALVNMLKKGSAGLDEYRAKAQKLGIVIEEDLLRGASKAKDQLAIMSRVVSSNLTSAVLTLAPQITKLTENFTEGLPAIIAWVNNFLRWAGLIEQSPLEKVNEELEIVNAKLLGVGAAEAGMIGVVSGIKNMWNNLVSAGESTEDLKNKQKELITEVKRLEAEEESRHKAAVEAAQIEANAQIKKIQTAAEFAKIEAKKKEDLKVFNELFKQMTTDEFELERLKVEESVKNWIKAGADKTEADRVGAEKRKKIDEDEFRAKMQLAQKFLQIISEIGNMRLQKELEQIQTSLENQELAADESFEIEKARLTAKFTVDEKLTKEGLMALAHLENSHKRKLLGIQRNADAKEKAAKKRQNPIKYAQVISNTAVEASKVLANPIAFGLVLAAGAVQLASVNSVDFGRGGIFSTPTDFSFGNGRRGRVAERPGKKEAILPLSTGPGGELGVNASGLGGDIILQQYFSFEGITEENFIMKKVIPVVEGAAKKGMTDIITTKNPKRSLISAGN